MSDFDDEMFDIEAVAAGAWVPGPYGSGDRLGTYNEVGPEKRAAALGMLASGAPLHTYSLGVEVFNGFPAFADRCYEQQLVLAGYQPAGDFQGVVRYSHPLGPNRVSYHEEKVLTSYNLASKINGLLHVGLGDLFYGGLRGDEIARSWGAAELDTTTWGEPLLTRGFLLDLVELEIARGGNVQRAEGGGAMLGDNHRVHLEDLVEASQRQGLPAFEAGDAILLRTGWGNLVRSDPERFLRASPGPWLRETRWLASFRPALVATDSWVWGTLDPDVTGGNYSACHQELCMRFGIRFGEGFGLEAVAAAGVDRFVLCHNPLAAEGGTSASSPAIAIAAEPGRAPERPGGSQESA